MFSLLLCTVLTALFALPRTLTAADYTILSRNCTKKDAIWWDRSQSGSAGSSCGCPCGSATWMGIDGRSHSSKSGNIYYRFGGTSGTYDIMFLGKKDNECATNYTITIGSKTLSGQVEKGSGEDRDYYKGVSISNGQEIKVWAKSCFPAGVDHGSYNRWGRMELTKVGGSTDPDPDPQPDPDPDPTNPPAQVTNLRATDVSGTAIALAWDAASGATSYNLYWTTVDVNNPDATVTATSHTITGLTPSTEYSIWIKSKNDDGMAKGTNLVVTTDGTTGALGAADRLRAHGEFTLTIAGRTTIAVGRGDRVSLFSLDGTQIVSRAVSAGDDLRIGSLRPGAYVLRHGRVDGSTTVHSVLVE